MAMFTTREPRVGDIWLVHYPYTTPGNMEKVRPGIILEFEGNDKVIVQKLTTRNKRGNKIFIHPKLRRKTYISKETMSIYDYNLVRYLGNMQNAKIGE